MLPPRIRKAPKRATRWRSRAHCDFVRSHQCSRCLSSAAIEVAHVRLGSQAGMGQRPDDWRTVSLCHDCHMRQHRQGEASFWAGFNVEGLIDAFIKASPKRAEIEAIQRERLAA